MEFLMTRYSVSLILQPTQRCVENTQFRVGIGAQWDYY